MIVKDSIQNTSTSIIFSFINFNFRAEGSIKQELSHLNSVLIENGFLQDILQLDLRPPTAHTTENTDSEEFTKASFPLQPYRSET